MPATFINLEIFAFILPGNIVLLSTVTAGDVEALRERG